MSFMEVFWAKDNLKNNKNNHLSKMQVNIFQIFIEMTLVLLEMNSIMS